MSTDEVEIIKADLALQERVGTGPLDQNKIAECEVAMDQAKVNFKPLAEDLLGQLSETIKKLKANTLTKAEATDEMRIIVMQIKAGAGTFNYELMGKLASIMLSFLEGIKEVDDNVIQIVEAHHKTLSIIILKSMSGDGGPSGKMLEDELKAACNRYYENAAPKS